MSHLPSHDILSEEILSGKCLLWLSDFGIYTLVVLVVFLSTTVQGKAKAIKGNRRECFFMAVKQYQENSWPTIRKVSVFM